MNAPPRYELFVLEDGDKPVELAEDTKIPNAATVTILKQDHTLGNMIRAQLLSMPQILFAGYKVPHPLHPNFQIKIQTDGTITPAVALEQACTALIGTLSGLETKFKREFAFRDVDGAGAGGMGMGGGEDPYGVGMGGQGGQGQGQWNAGRDYLDF
ncbi:hypothetical protein HWV62_21772 [Athelia sp. TMB]|nr:hypothetical protein HWV62_21772 [Athelia sp. TMB]